MNARVLQAIKESAAVPSIPQVVSRFIEIMRDPDFSYDDLVKTLSSDPGTVSEILRVSNSALFGVRQKVVSLRHALTLLGPKRTRSLLLGRYLVDVMARKKLAALDMSYFWRRSLASSVIASRFAHVMMPNLLEEAFIAALLADIGIPILAEAMPDCYGTIAAEFKPYGKSPSPEREHKAVQATHGEVSAMVLAHWTLPSVVTSAVNLHQSPPKEGGDAGAVARLLKAADALGRLLCEIPREDEVVTVCGEATALVGVDMDVVTELLPTIERDIEELASALRIDVIPTNVYALITKTVQEKLIAPASF